MRTYAAILLSLCVTSLVAQDREQIWRDSIELYTAARVDLRTLLLPRLNLPSSFPFDSIIFKDVRSDTTNIGTTNNVDFLTKKGKFAYLKAGNGLGIFMTLRLNAKFDAQRDSISEKLICYIRKFRMTEIDTGYESNPRRFRQVRIRSAIDVFYFKQGLFYPAFKSDTSFIQFFPENKRNYHIIDSLVLKFCERAAILDKQRILTRKNFSESYIDSVYRSRFNAPILNADSLKRGVYGSLKEFLNNNPSIEDYEWKPDRAVNILYTREQGNWVVTRRQVFGFCDGRNIWFRIENSFYPAFKEGNAFLVIAPIYLKRKKAYTRNYTYMKNSGGYTYGDIMVVDEKDKSVYQLDMDTGEFY